MIYPIQTFIFIWHIFPKCWQNISNTNWPFQWSFVKLHKIQKKSVKQELCQVLLLSTLFLSTPDSVNSVSVNYVSVNSVLSTRILSNPDDRSVTAAWCRCKGKPRQGTLFVLQVYFSKVLHLGNWISSVTSFFVSKLMDFPHFHQADIFLPSPLFLLLKEYIPLVRKKTTTLVSKPGQGRNDQMSLKIVGLTRSDDFFFLSQHWF